MSQTEIQDLIPLFEDVQLTKVFPDGKTFVDCLPKDEPERINEKYIQQKSRPDFNLEKFVLENFNPPTLHSNGYSSNPKKSVEENIETLWNVLTREPDEKAGSLIPLPYPYIVPGGRFGEIYYWDSYFTMLGLKASQKNEMLENMVKNFSYLIDTVGHIPNGNRTYYLSRSQPPFYSLMVRMLSEIKGKEVLSFYLPQLEKEHQYWMTGSIELDDQNRQLHHVVRMPGGEILNRYWDERDTPRPEAYKEDLELIGKSSGDPKKICHHLRAGAESGWDFSSRWFKDGHSLRTIRSSDLVPVDLNCLLMHLEQVIEQALQLNNQTEASKYYRVLAESRKNAINKYCWNRKLNFYVDYDAVENKAHTHLNLAACFPLFFRIASEEQAQAVASTISNKFLKPGGVVTTLETTGEQWDAPNGWAPLQWMAIVGLENYGHEQLAKEIAHRWMKLNADVFKRTGKLMEKYNVVNTDLDAGGGEYPGQDGFGWTNGVFLALVRKYGMS